VLCETGWHANDGWPRAFQACKGGRNKMLLDQDMKGSLKVKVDRSMVFGLHL
jgi:hypothetical protein